MATLLSDFRPDARQVEEDLQYAMELAMEESEGFREVQGDQYNPQDRHFLADQVEEDREHAMWLAMEERRAFDEEEVVAAAAVPLVHDAGGDAQNIYNTRAGAHYDPQAESYLASSIEGDVQEVRDTHGSGYAYPEPPRTGYPSEEYHAQMRSYEERSRAYYPGRGVGQITRPSEMERDVEEAQMMMCPTCRMHTVPIENPARVPFSQCRDSSECLTYRCNICGRFELGPVYERQHPVWWDIFFHVMGHFQHDDNDWRRVYQNSS